MLCNRVNKLCLDSDVSQVPLRVIARWDEQVGEDSVCKQEIWSQECSCIFLLLQMLHSTMIAVFSEKSPVRVGGGAVY